ILAVGPNVGDILKRFGGQIGAPQLSLKKEGPAENITVAYNITPEVADQVLKNSGKTYASLKGAIDAAGTPQTQVIKADISTSFVTETKDAKAVDVLGYLPGSDPKLKDEVLVISAHYDHIGMLPEGNKDRVNNGADDDGSGTTSVMEIARAFSKARKDGHGPRRSILFLGNVGEEKGLLGSEYYTDHPVIPLANTIADLNIDMVGRVGFDYIGKPDSANYVYVIGSSMLSSGLHNVSEKANSTYTQLHLDYKYDDLNDPNHFYERSDHYNFAKHGVPIIFYFNGVHADYHRPGDEVSKINFPLLAKRAQLVFYTAWDLLNADTRPVVDAKK
ncbi:MAG: M28 family peptidase, partial [Mucilaginibacter sp.]